MAAGFRSLLAPWIGGASIGEVVVTAAAAPISLLAFWIGGAVGNTPIIVPPVTEPEIVNYSGYRAYNFKILEDEYEEEDEEAVVIAILLEVAKHEYIH